jgi:hypothetical protein
MKSLNIIILVLFSLCGIVFAQENIQIGFASEWSDIFFLFPASLITGIMLLGTSIINYPINTWDNFSINNFALNPTQPHSFILFIGLVFTMAGIVGFLTAFILPAGSYKLPAMTFFMGSGVFVAGLLGCLYVNFKKRKT